VTDSLPQEDFLKKGSSGNEAKEGETAQPDREKRLAIARQVSIKCKKRRRSVRKKI